MSTVAWEAGRRAGLREATDVLESEQRVCWHEHQERRVACSQVVAQRLGVLIGVVRRRGEEDAGPTAITSVGELDALPDGSIVRCAIGSAWRKGNTYTPAEPWWCAGSEVEEPSSAITLPALLLWHPDWAQR